jgi:hypothetical protein
MTVGELIERLNKIPNKNIEVCRADFEVGAPVAIKDVVICDASYYYERKDVGTGTVVVIGFDRNYYPSRLRPIGD